MTESDKFYYYDTSKLVETEGMLKRCDTGYISEQLTKKLPGEQIKVMSVSLNVTGNYKNKSVPALFRMIVPIFNTKGLPPYCEVKLEHITGEYTEEIIVWSPLAWNDRFIGTGGGGIGTGGEGYITQPTNTRRGQSLTNAICNGFTSATTNGGAGKGNWAIDKKTAELKPVLIENWRAASTHFMTLAGKAVAEILHDRPVLYSYFHGGSGGGRQAMVETQEYPDDYNGIWASCPAINWTKFVLLGFWPIVVMNHHKNIISFKKIEYFMECAQNSIGGKEAYYKYDKVVSFDPHSVIGQKCKDGVITKADADVMQEIWDGPHRSSGERLWYMFRPGVKFWNKVLPIGAFYYTLTRKIKPFPVAEQYLRWVTQDFKQDYNTITKAQFVELFDKSAAKFPKLCGDNADLTPFVKAGGKLMIDHGIDDPLIPVDGSIDYYERMIKVFGNKAAVANFCRMYITPGDGHGDCTYHGPGITESAGMKALVDWVEKGIAPAELRIVQVNKKREIVQEGTRKPY